MENAIKPLSLIVIVLAIVLMLALMYKTDILRDQSECPKGEKPFSLSKVQFAFWTLIIFCSFVYMWGQVGLEINQVKLTKTALILLGVSTGTTILGSTIDKSDIENKKKGRISKRHQDQCSDGFLWDLLRDGTGNVSIHRYQNVMFTLVLMIAFIVHVMKSCGNDPQCTMPEFDEMLLVLSGISSGGYLGIKANENG